MSSALSLIGDAFAPYALISSPSRGIGTIIPDVTVEETHRDNLQITDHPVETGAAISDHAFILPSEIEIRAGFSNATAQAEGYVQSIYQEFLVLQASRQPFNVSTGKRQYSSMLIRSLTTATDETTETTLNITVGLRRINIVSTSGGGATAPQANPQQTAPTTDGGTVTPNAASQVPTFASGQQPFWYKSPGSLDYSPFGSLSNPFGR